MAQDLFANPKGRENEQIRVFGIIKSLTAYNYSTVSNVCRERCGGGGYLAYNRISSGIEGSQVAITGEGDNQVMM